MVYIEKVETKTTERKKCRSYKNIEKRSNDKKVRRKKYRTYKNVEKLEDGGNEQFTNKLLL
jgi:hypothetical protein